MRIGREEYSLAARGTIPVLPRGPTGLCSTPMSLPSASRKVLAGALALVFIATFAPGANAMFVPELERAAGAALSKLYARNSKAAEIGRRAVAVLVFPNAHMVGAGLAVQSATGVLFHNRQALAYFNLTGFSAGLELGVRKFDYVIFFETGEAMEKIYQAGGFELGVAPTLVIGDGMLAGKLSTTSAREGVDVFVSGQLGFMVSLGIGKTKITEYEPED